MSSLPLDLVDNSSALLNILDINVISLYEDLKIIGSDLNSIEVFCLNSTFLLSKDNVKSKLSKNLNLSLDLSILTKNIPNCSTFNANTPCCDIKTCLTANSIASVVLSVSSAKIMIEVLTIFNL